MKSLAFGAILTASLAVGIGGVAHAADRVDVMAQRVAAAAAARQAANGGRAVADAPVSGPTVSSIALTLINDWVGGSYSTNQPSVEFDDSVVRFKGGMSTSGTNSNPFVLPKGFRPKAVVYIPVDMCNATNGRLVIDTTGFVTVQAAGDFSNAQCFVSLEGVSFSLNGTGYKKLKLLNGWGDTPYGTAQASARISKGVVQFQGSMSTSGTNGYAFKLPKEMRPTKTVYVPVDLCNATNGRLIIYRNGDVTVQAESDFGNAQCFTSLDGVSFTPNAVKNLHLVNGWAPYGFGTGRPGIDNQNGVVHFVGAIATTGTNAQPFVLPVTARPAAETYVKVDLCGATNGRLHISPNGTVSVQAETVFSNAQCFTSLDGATFVQ